MNWKKRKKVRTEYFGECSKEELSKVRSVVAGISSDLENMLIFVAG